MIDDRGNELLVVTSLDEAERRQAAITRRPGIREKLRSRVATAAP
jgi:hypothetical protein